MAEDEPGTISSPSNRLSDDSTESGDRIQSQTKKIPSKKTSRPNILVRFIRAVFGYRKTSVTLLVSLTIVCVLLLTALSDSLEYSVKLPTDDLEQTILTNSWLDLQNIGRKEHPYSAEGNDYVHDYLEKRIKEIANKRSSFIEFDNDLNYTNNVMFGNNYEAYNQVTYFESNNLLVRINGTNNELPALLVSAHYDSVPTSFGITDDGMGIASLLGTLSYFSSDGVDQPNRTIILNFNNNEEFGLMGAISFLSHPWFKQVKYFLNLEGTGAGGKAILFRGTDYGIVKYFKKVRFPFATSLFQQGFNNRLIHSETDYKIYKENGGLRGLDLAFYKPRDIYHTAGDNIKNIKINSLWHMLSNSLDFVQVITSQRIDLDDEYIDDESNEKNGEFPVFSSFLNWFFVIPVSHLILLNIASLVIVPLLSLPFLIIIFHYKKNWKINFINAIKYPLSLILSFLLLNFVTHNILVSINEFLPNSSYGLIVTALFCLFLLLNYLLLNGINFIFKGYKIFHHDEKLVVIIQTSFIYWVLLIISTNKLSHNQIGDDHTGEFPLIVLFLLQSFGALFGLLGWSFKKSNYHNYNDDDEACHALLSHDENNTYGTNEGDSSEHRDNILPCSTTSLGTLQSQVTNNLVSNLRKSFSYDWSIQYIIIVPLSWLIIYNSGSLLLSGLNKSIQESLMSEKMIYNLIQLFAIALTVPLLPFTFKFNRILVIAVVLILCHSFASIIFMNPFDELNPLKLRFIQSINLDSPSNKSVVSVYGRNKSPMNDVLRDLPSLKEAEESLECTLLLDGMQECSYNSSLLPVVSPDSNNLGDYLEIEIIKNSSSDYPFGLLSGEIKIIAPKNRVCQLSFNNSNFENPKQSPVRTVMVYDDNNNENSSVRSAVREANLELTSLPEGFSKDDKGTYIFKNLNGIDKFQLNKVSWSKPYHIGFYWMPKFMDVALNNEYEKFPVNTDFNDLGITVDCFWSDLGYVSDAEGRVEERIPAYGEVLHFSPNYVSWANKESGLVTVKKYVEI